MDSIRPILFDKHRHSERGLTLVELMVSITLSSILVIVVFQMIIQAQTMAEIMFQRIRFNEEARLLFELAANGGFSDMNGDGDIKAAFPDERIPGLRSAKDFTPNLLSNFTSYQWDGADNTTVQIAARSVFNRFSLFCERGTILSTSSPRIQSSAAKKLVCLGLASPSLDCPNSSTYDMGLLYNGRMKPDFTTLYPLVDPVYGSSNKMLQIKFELVDPDTIQGNFNTDTSKEVIKTFFNLPWAEREYYRTSFFLMGDY